MYHVKRTTLCYIRKENEILMLFRNKKKDDPNEGKWIGVGGKIEEGETPDQCMLREVFEETGIRLKEYTMLGIIEFRSDVCEDEDMNLYEAVLPEGAILEECNEGTLKWIPESELLSLDLWEGDKIFLGQLLKHQKPISLTLWYHGDRLIKVKDKTKTNFFVAFFGHLHTINHHRRLVRRGCFKIGLIKQGLLHDLSKYSFTEFFTGVRYFQGTRSPNAAERYATGMSLAWMHHKGRNKHHAEFWTDFSMATGNPVEFMEMPRKYLYESVMDRIAASKVYRGKDYKDSDPLEYLLTRDSNGRMNEKNFENLKEILSMLAQKGEKETFRYLKKTARKKEK